MKDENIRQKFMLYKLNEVQKRADRKFQLLRRLEEASSSGICKCISCGRFHHYKQMDGGHFIPRGHKGTRYEKINVWPQCVHCNHYLHGNHAKFRENLIKKIGEDGVKNLEETKDILPYHQSVSWREWCIDVYIKSKNRIREFEKFQLQKKRLRNIARRNPG